VSGERALQGESAMVGAVQNTNHAGCMPQRIQACMIYAYKSQSWRLLAFMTSSLLSGDSRSSLFWRRMVRGRKSVPGHLAMGARIPNLGTS
jgi:hypothetical protein